MEDAYCDYKGCDAPARFCIWDVPGLEDMAGFGPSNDGDAMGFWLCADHYDYLIFSMQKENV